MPTKTGNVEVTLALDRETIFAGGLAPYVGASAYVAFIPLAR